MKIVDIVCIIIIILGAIAGYKKGAIKGLVHLIGLVAIAIVSFQLKGLFANIMIKYLPFFNFGGVFHDIYTVNFLIYEGIAFAVIFVLLYCVLNILVNLSGILDLLVKMTIILELPSKIIGAILGAVESLIFIFIATFVALQFAPSQKYVMESKVAKTIVERTPVVNIVYAQSIVAAESIYNEVMNAKDSEDKLDANLAILRILISRGIVDPRDVNIAIDSGKIPNMAGVVVQSGQ
jgi:uncharacterized membrane protein required for colicin V production